METCHRLVAKFVVGVARVVREHHGVCRPREGVQPALGPFPHHPPQPHLQTGVVGVLTVPKRRHSVSCEGDLLGGDFPIA
jgi:hypothetical protein